MRYFYPKTAEEAVTNGAEMLDRIEPGWADKIDLEQFDIDSDDSCVLGQLYGGYQDSKYEVAGKATGYPEWFLRDPNVYPWDDPASVRCDDLLAQYGLYSKAPFSFGYRELGPIWREEIYKRRTDLTAEAIDALN